MKVAVVHDWLTQIAGAERVLEEILRLYPEATLFMASGRVAHEAGGSIAQELAFAASSAGTIAWRRPRCAASDTIEMMPGVCRTMPSSESSPIII